MNNSLSLILLLFAHFTNSPASGCKVSLLFSLLFLSWWQHMKPLGWGCLKEPRVPRQRRHHCVMLDAVMMKCVYCTCIMTSLWLLVLGLMKARGSTHRHLFSSTSQMISKSQLLWKNPSLATHSLSWIPWCWRNYVALLPFVRLLCHWNLNKTYVINSYQSSRWKLQ